MKRLIAALSILMAINGKLFAAVINTDVFPYQNYTATFTKTVDLSEIQSFSLQVVYSTAPQPTGVNADSNKIDIANDTIFSTVTYGLGQQVLVSTLSSTNNLPAGLVTGTTYYVVPVSDNLFKLINTSTGAVAGLSIDLTAVSTHTLIYVTPLNISMGASGMTWEASNDGTNFVSVGSSCTMTTVGTGGISSQIRDFGSFAYRYLRMTFNGVTAGTMKLRVFLNGRRQ